jgi:hypothetical protein
VLATCAANYNKGLCIAHIALHTLARLHIYKCEGKFRRVISPVNNRIFSISKRIKLNNAK